MKIISLRLGTEGISLVLPEGADIRSLPKMTPLESPADILRQRLQGPLGCVPLRELAQGRRNAAVVVSDYTRPVPYAGERGILGPILDELRQGGVADIRIIVACGTHRAMMPKELETMLGGGAFQKGVRIINHDAVETSTLRVLGRTDRTREVTVNRHYLEAELKIVTGLVEPHFMAGYSGGRKAVCPGICGQEVARGFHSARILDHPRAMTLVLEGNPCHEEALMVAKMAGVDFCVNVTINSEKSITGIFAGELETAHAAAVEALQEYVTIPLESRYDIVVIPAGDVGVNHYQCAKAAHEGSRAVKPGGYLIVAAELSDPDPVGGENYKEMLRMLSRVGPTQFRENILAPQWQFVPEQWQVQMWAKIFESLGGMDHIYTCAARLKDQDVPERNAAREQKQKAGETDIGFTERMLQTTIDNLLAASPKARVLILPDGPYGIPILKK